MTAHGPLRRLRALAVNLALTAATVVALLAICELTLRLTGFSYVLYPEEIEFGSPDPVMLKTGFVEDEAVFWVPPGYGEELARLRAARPALIFLGDSCTQLGRYDDAFARRVAAQQGATQQGAAPVYGNLGVAGWSSYQGVRQLERDVLPLGPAVVTIYYGWNDHWIGFGIEDEDVGRIKRLFSSRWSRLRLVQLVVKAAVAFGVRTDEYPQRVSRDDFAANLRRMVRAARAAGVEPVLLTAPSSHVRGREPAYLGQRWLRDLSQLVPLHQSYVAAVREVATAEGAVLCDLAADFAALDPEALAASFMADGIHPTAEGDLRLAGFLYDCFAEHGLLARIVPR